MWIKIFDKRYEHLKPKIEELKGVIENVVDVSRRADEWIEEVVGDRGSVSFEVILEEKVEGKRYEGCYLRLFPGGAVVWKEEVDGRPDFQSPFPVTKTMLGIVLL